MAARIVAGPTTEVCVQCGCNLRGLPAGWVARSSASLAVAYAIGAPGPPKLDRKRGHSVSATLHGRQGKNLNEHNVP